MKMTKLWSALALIFAAGMTWGATPSVIFDGDFHKLNWSDTGVATKTVDGITYTINRNGHTIVQDGDRSYILIGANANTDKIGVTITRDGTPTATGATALIRYTDYPTYESGKYMMPLVLHNNKNDNLYNNIAGVFVTDANGTVKGEWADFHSGVRNNNDASCVAFGSYGDTLALVYGDGTDEKKGIYAYQRSDEGWSKIYKNTTLTGANTFSIKGFAVGGLYLKQNLANNSAKNTGSAATFTAGMKVHAIAITYTPIVSATDPVLTAFAWPSDDPAAECNGVRYSTLAKAITAATGATEANPVEITLLKACSETITIPQYVTVKTSTSARFTGTVTSGEGRIVFDGYVPEKNSTTASSLQNDAWTGTVEIKDFDLDNASTSDHGIVWFDKLSNSNSKLAMNNVTSTAFAGGNPTYPAITVKSIEIMSGGLTLDSGAFGTTDKYTGDLIGSGPISVTGFGSTHGQVCFKGDHSGFTGNVIVGDADKTKRIVFLGKNEDFPADSDAWKSIYVSSGVSMTIPATATWTAPNGMTVAGNLDVHGQMTVTTSLALSGTIHLMEEGATLTVPAAIDGWESKVLSGVDTKNVDYDADNKTFSLVAAAGQFTVTINGKTLGFDSFDAAIEKAASAAGAVIKLSNASAEAPEGFVRGANGVLTAADYIVISPSSYVDAWKTYVEARKTSPVAAGITFGVKNAADIYASDVFKAVANSSDGTPRNDAESIHKWIGMMQKLGTQYFVLGSRWKDAQKWSAGDRATSIPGVVAYPTQKKTDFAFLDHRASDLYYACHYKAEGQAYVWDPNGDGVYVGLCETSVDNMADKRHFTPNCVVSRMDFYSASRTYQQSISDYTAKLIKAETQEFSGADRYVAWTAQCKSFDASGLPDVYGVMKTRVNSIDAVRGAKELLHLLYLSVEPTLENPDPPSIMPEAALVENKASLFDENWEVFLPFGHGTPDGFAGLSTEEFGRSTGLIKFFMANIPCLTGSQTALYNGASAALANPNGGSLVSVNNASYGYLTEAGILGRYCGLSDELADHCLDAYVGGATAGEAWKTAIATLSGNIFTESGINAQAVEDRGHTGDEIYIYAAIVEQMLFGDPLVKIQVPKKTNKISTLVQRTARDHYFCDDLKSAADGEYANTDAKSWTVVDGSTSSAAMDVPENKSLTVESGKTLTNTSNEGIIVRTSGSIGGSGTVNSKITFEPRSTIVVPSATAWLKIAKDNTMTVLGAINFVLPMGTKLASGRICVLEKDGLTDEEFAKMSVGSVTIPTAAARSLKLAGEASAYQLTRAGNKVMLGYETVTITVPTERGVSLKTVTIVTADGEEVIRTIRMQSGETVSIADVPKGATVTLNFAADPGFTVVDESKLTVTLDNVQADVTVESDNLPHIAVATVTVGETTTPYADFASAKSNFDSNANSTLTVIRPVTIATDLTIAAGKTFVAKGSGDFTAKNGETFKTITVASGATIGGDAHVNANITLADGAWFDASTSSKMTIAEGAVVSMTNPKVILPAETTILPGADKLIVYNQKACSLQDGVLVTWKAKGSEVEHRDSYSILHVPENGNAVYIKDAMGTIEIKKVYADNGAVIVSLYADFGDGLVPATAHTDSTGDEVFTIMRGSRVVLVVTPDANHKGIQSSVTLDSVYAQTDVDPVIPMYAYRDPTTIYWNTTKDVAEGNMDGDVVLKDGTPTKIIPGDTLVIGEDGYNKPASMLTLKSSLILSDETNKGKVVIKNDLTVTGGDANIMLNNVDFEIGEGVTVTIAPTEYDFAFGATSVAGGTIEMRATTGAKSNVIKAMAMDATSTLIKVFDPIELKSSAADGKTPLYVKGTFEGNGTFGSDMIAIGDLRLVLVPEAQGVDKNYLKFRGGVSAVNPAGGFYTLAFDARALSATIQKGEDGKYPTIPLFEVVYPDGADQATKTFIDGQVANAAYIARLIQPEITDGGARVMWQLAAQNNRLEMRPVVKDVTGQFFQDGILLQNEEYLFTKDFASGVETIDVRENNKTLSFVFAAEGVGSSEQIQVRLPINLNDKSLTINVPADKTVYLEGVIRGSGSLVKTGEGKLVFNGGNIFTGTLTVSGGTIATTNATGFGPAGKNITAAANTTIDFANVGAAAYNVTTGGTLTNTKADTTAGNRGQIQSLTLTGNTTISGASFGMAPSSTINLAGHKITVAMNPSICGGTADTIKHNIFALNGTTANRETANDNVKDPDITVVSGSIGSYGSENDLTKIAMKVEANGAICIDQTVKINRIWTISGNSRISAVCSVEDHNHSFDKVFYATGSSEGNLVIAYELFGGITAPQIVFGIGQSLTGHAPTYTPADMENPEIPRIILDDGDYIDGKKGFTGNTVSGFFQCYCLDWDGRTGARRLFYNISKHMRNSAAQIMWPWGVVYEKDEPIHLVLGDWYPYGSVEHDVPVQSEDAKALNTNPLSDPDWGYIVPSWHAGTYDSYLIVQATISKFDGNWIYTEEGQLDETVLSTTNGLLAAECPRPDKRSLDFVVDRAWLTEHGLTSYTEGKGEVSAWLNAIPENGNGVERWQSYMLGLDPDDPHSLPVLEVRTDVAPSVRKNGKDYVNVCVGGTNVYGFQFIAPVYAIEQVEKDPDGNMQVVDGTLTPWQNSTNFQVEVPTKGPTTKSATSGDHVKYFRVRVSFQGNDAFTN